MTLEWDERSMTAGGPGKPPAAEDRIIRAGHAAQIMPEDTGFRLMTLELENLRLTRLVAELLMKNQQLRERLGAV